MLPSKHYLAKWLASAGLLVGLASIAVPLRADAPLSTNELKFEHPDKTGKRLTLPPGLFTDGFRYDLSELKGKVVVLLYFEPSRGDAVKRTMDRLESMRLYATRPVKVLGISRGDLAGTRNAFRQFKGVFPPANFDPSDALGHMWFISGRSESFCVFDPAGDVCVWSSVGELGETVATACAKATWKYKDDGYNKALDPAIDLLEWNHYPEGMKLLPPLRKDARKPVAESAEKLFGVIKAEGEAWKADADKALNDDPMKAYDLYTKLAGAFVGEDLGKAAADAIKALKAKKDVADELAAREMLAQLSQLPYDPRRTPAMAGDLLKQVMAKYPETPAAARAKAFRQEIPPAF